MDFTSEIIKWYEANQRQLPWRETTDPYLIWISEIILQQTQVKQGLSYYLRFVERFPNVRSLADASTDEVLQYWQGLGYYSRARNLHQAAQLVMQNGGAFPTDYKGVRALKGVGDYTAAAICSFAYKQPCAVVDGNVYRVLSRFFGVETPIDSTKGKREFSELAMEVLDKKHPDVYNQAIMDFGAKHCSPSRPLCETCPLSGGCIALSTGRVSVLPVKSKKTKQEIRHLVYVIIRCGNVVYIRQRPPGDIWAGLYEPVLLEFNGEASDREVVENVGKLVGDSLKGMRCVKKQMKHVLTHRVLMVDAYEADIEAPVSIDGYIYVENKELCNYPVSRLVEKIFECTCG